MVGHNPALIFPKQSVMMRKQNNEGDTPDDKRRKDMVSISSSELIHIKALSINGC